MVIMIPDLSGISQGIQTGSSALAEALDTRAQNRLMQRRQGALESALADKSLDLQTQSGQQDFLRRTTAAGIPTQDSLGILDRAIKMQSASQQPFGTDDPEKLAGLFHRLGIEEGLSKDYADLYANLSQGGKTSFANMFIENMQRGQAGKPTEPIEAQDVQVDEFVWPEVNMFEGLVPKEKVSREKELFNANAKDFQDLKVKMKGLRDDDVRVGQLNRYNESGKLPKGMEKFNINWKTGDIRFPALANAETQGFVKTINDFTVKAKDTFGARVTNFELASFMKRLPTLANSEEGRRLIIDQMQAMGDLDRLYYDSLKDVYDQYGLRGIDSQKAEEIASQLRFDQEQALIQKVNDSVSANEVFELKGSLPEGHVLIEYEGRRVGVPEAQLDRAVSKGGRVL